MKKKKNIAGTAYWASSDSRKYPSHIILPDAVRPQKSGFPLCNHLGSGSAGRRHHRVLRSLWKRRQKAGCHDAASGHKSRPVHP